MIPTPIGQPDAQTVFSKSWSKGGFSRSQSKDSDIGPGDGDSPAIMDVRLNVLLDKFIAQLVALSTALQPVDTASHAVPSDLIHMYDGNGTDRRERRSRRDMRYSEVSNSKGKGTLGDSGERLLDGYNSDDDDRSTTR